MNHRRWSRRTSCLLAMSMSALAMGCTTVTRPPNRAFTAMAKEGHASVVLLRLDMSGLRGPSSRRFMAYNGKGTSSQGSGWFWLRVAPLDAGDAVQNISPVRCPSDAARKDKWVYLELPVGRYWICLVSPGSVADSHTASAFTTIPPIRGTFGSLYRGEFFPVPGFLLDVRHGEPVLYAGTLKATYSDPDDRKSVVNVHVENETERARGVMDADLSPHGLSTLRTRLLAPYGAPLPPDRIHELAPFGLVSLPAPTIQREDWMGLAMGRWMAPGAAMAEFGGEWGLLLAMAYTPFGLAGGAMQGSGSREAWEPIHRALAEELTRIRPTVRLGEQLKHAFAEHLHSVPIVIDSVDAHAIPVVTNDVRTLVFATISRIKLREGSRRATCAIEIGYRVRLWDLQDRAWVYEDAFVYAEWNPNDRITLPCPFEKVLPVASIAFSPDPDQGTDARTRLREAVEHANALLIEELRDEFNLHDRLPDSELLQLHGNGLQPFRDGR